MKPFEQFDTSLLKILPLEKRKSDLHISCIQPLKDDQLLSAEFKKVANRMIVNRNHSGSKNILMMGAHVIRSGVQQYIIDMMENKWIDCIAMNGAGMIHDYEFALLGETTESVADYIQEGQFGLWRETGRINDIINQGCRSGMGIGQCVGRQILIDDLKYKEISILANACRMGIPVTIHVGIGMDIIHEHPNFDGAMTGAATYTDFLIFSRMVQQLEGGVIMNFGSAVMAPEVFLKALSMARNVARTYDTEIKDFYTLVCDIVDLPKDYSVEPSKTEPAYYFRPLKTMLVRTVRDGGTSFYVKGRHERTIPGLWTALKEVDSDG